MSYTKPGVLCTDIDLMDRDFINRPTREDLVDYAQGDLLGFCTCGTPEDNIRYVLAGLDYIAESMERDRNKMTHDQWWPGYQERGNLLFGNENSKYFFYYYVDNAGLTEHGGGVGGAWLTTEGQILREKLAQVIQRIKEIDDDQHDQEQG